MKQFFSVKKILLFFLSFLIAFNPVFVFAAVEQRSYDSNSLETKANIITKIGSSTIINLSDKKFFVPNNTSGEYDAWSKNAPNYVKVSVCPNQKCEEGEDIYSCPADCNTNTDKYCGDGICSQATVIYASTTVLATVPGVACKKKGWLAVVVGVVVGGVVTVATGGVGIGLGAGLASGIITGVLIPSNANCGQPIPIYEISVKKGEVYNLDEGSNYVEQIQCKSDCPPPSGSGCGICGYDSIDGSRCPNYCSNRGYNMINCKLYTAQTIIPNENGTLQSLVKRKPLQQYLTASEALAFEQEPGYQTEESGYYYKESPYYGCDYSSSEATNYYCPAGTYCPHTGGMKTGTPITSYVTTTWKTLNLLTDADLVPKTCPAGYFCPAGSFYKRPCPINTFSTGGAEKCTACSPGTNTSGNSAVTSEAYCQPTFKIKDSVCNTTEGEGPVNSSFDCPDSSHISMFKGDGRCSGVESMADNPEDCKCGDGICNNLETYLSCLPDCAGADNVCGSVLYSSNGTRTIIPERNVYKSYEATTTNKSVCKYMNDGEVCGDGTCSPGEEYRYISDLGKSQIICPLDCHCGDGYCNSSQGENWNWSTNSGSCKQDCKCGNKTCDSNESSYFCMADCHCGNRKCDEDYNENAYNCSGDCRCGDNICSAGETSCTNDCGAGWGICDDGVCAYMEMGFGKRVKETLANCPEDCARGYTQE